jgi:hypothetical protein
VDRYLRFESGLFGAYRDELTRARDLLVPSAAWRRLLHEVLDGLGAPGGRVERRGGNGWEVLEAIGVTPRREQALEVPLGEVLALADSVGELVARPGLS